MTPKLRRRRPELESLEGRTLLSGAARPELIDRTRALALLAPAAARGTGASAAAARTGQATGFVRSAEATNSTTIRVQFRTPIARQLASRLRYEVSGLEVTGAQLARDGRSVVLTTTPQDGSGYTARVSIVQGAGGRARVVRRGTAPFSGRPAPRVVDVQTVSDTSLLVTYNQSMGPQAAVPGNYALVAEGAQPVQVTGARFVGQGNSVVEVRTTPQSFGSYAFNVYNVSDTSGQQVFFEGRNITGNPQGAVISVAATSATTVVVAFNEPMADNALAPQHYIITAPGGARLLVTHARFDGPLGMVVILTTAAQSNAVYQLTATNITDLQNDGLHTNTGSFQGIAAPALTRAVPTGPTSLVLTFTGPVGDSALAPSTYRVEQLNALGNVVGTLPVNAAAFVGGQRTVVELATGPQADAPYRITTTAALTDLAGTPLPASSATFQGVGNRPTLVTARSTGPGTALVTFSEAMTDDALSPASYSIRNAADQPLRVLAARFVGGERRVVELITDPQADENYTITAITATDFDGNGVVVPADASINTFRGRGTSAEAPDIAGPPRVVGAASLNNREIIVVFSEPMADNAADPTKYIITQVSVNPGAGTLGVTAAEFYAGNRSVVKLTTLSQNELAYRVTVVNVTDRAGNPLAPKAPNDGGVADPTSSTFPGTPPRAGTLTDTDSDGVPDNEELRGWAVTIVLANGTVVVRDVTSDPTLADTDGDGIPDRVELAFRIDPRDADTDDDELPDAEELNDNRGYPNKQDSDGDGLTDKDEKLGWTITITLADGTTVTQQVTSNPFLPDTDFDGLLDRIEQLVMVDPRNPDSDGDGASDGEEVLEGRDPTTNNPGDNLPADPNEPPRVTGAASQGNTSVLVAFSKPMDDSVLVPGNYIIVQTNVNPEPGVLLLADGDDVFELGGYADRDLNGDGVVDPTPDLEWANAEHTAVLLTTFTQNELTYTVTVVNVRDLAGNAIPPQTIGGVVVNPAAANFPGTPPSAATDTDGDGLSDNTEMRGWFVTVQLVDGTTTTRGVTSDPTIADTDGDLLNDAQEANLRFDPRAFDTDDDQIDDNAEFNQLFSSGLDQDTDDDGLDDFVEFGFFRTSPIFADTDGDQISDGDEINSSIRNPRVADLPAPDIEIGDTNLQLDVRFTESTATGRRELESRSVSSTLQQSTRKEFSHTDSSQHEFSVKAGFEQKIETGIPENSYEFGFSQEVGYTGTWSSSSTSTSAQETQRSYQDSLQTDVETTENGTVERQVVGARMQVALTLKSAGTIAFRVQNLLVTAFIQDPQDPTSLRPIASLRPDFEPEGGFAVGPLVPERGPFIFTSDSVFPNLVESLMQNPRGLVFRLANFDIVDELGRNFAFTSQEIVERTGGVVFDFGGTDTDGDGEGDLTEYHRVATGTGREIDGELVAFDANGRPVGITLAEAMTAIGLTHYEARLDAAGNFVEYEPGGMTPVSLTLEELQSSYSTILDENGIARPFRIREVANQVSKAWVVLRPSGEIDASVGLNDKVLRSGADVRLAFIQDLDGDNLPASLEYLLNTVDSAADAFNNATWAAGADGIPDSVDTDKDGLNDRVEALVGWTVDLGGRGTRRVTSAGYLPDTDNDGLTDAQEAPALSAFEDLNGDGLLDRYNPALKATTDFVTDPANPDTDGDGVGQFIFIAPGLTTPRPSDDFAEINGYTIERIFTGGGFITGVTTDPTLEDHDGDGILDGVEVRFGLDPRDPTDKDSDRDGLPDDIEDTSDGDGGWTVTVYGVSTAPRVQGNATSNLLNSNIFDPDTDDDGLSDFAEFELKTDPRSRDTDGDGLTDIQEFLGIEVRDLGIIDLDPIDADLDNDLRSDGDEAEIVVDDEGEIGVFDEAKRWFVSTEGMAPYRVFSDPRFTDGDADGLVDGEEYGDFNGDGELDPRDFYNNDGRPDVGVYRTDPNNANTDGDRRNDGVEVKGGLNPLITDFRVTVVAEFIDIDLDGDGSGSATQAGEFDIELLVRLPDESGPGGLSDSFTTVYNRFDAIQDDVDNGLVEFRRDTPFANRSLTFSLASHQRFSIEGFIREHDAEHGYDELYLGGLEGIRATMFVPDDREGHEGESRGELIRPVFSAEEVLDQSIEDLVFDFDTDRDPHQRFAFTPEGPTGRLQGKLKFYYIIE